MRYKTKSYDVIVVGGGPSGLNTAKGLAENGLKVLLVEKKDKVGEAVVCSGVVGMEIFDKFNISRHSVLREIKTVELLSPSLTCIQYSEETPFACVIDRKIFDLELQKMALTKGAEIQLKSSVIDINVNSSSAEVHIKSDNYVATYNSRAVVLATGINTHLSKKLGLGFPLRFLIAVQEEVNLQKDFPLTIFVGNEISDSAFAWSIPSGDGRFRVGLMAEGNSKERFRRFTERNFPGVIFTNPQIKPIAQGLVTGTFRDRVLVVGEAAGQVKTTTGGGIYWGLLCSEIAVNVLLKAFKKDDFSAKTLSEYETLWHRLLESEIKAGLFVRKICSYLNDNQIERIIQLGKTDGIISFIKKKALFDWHGKVLLNLLGMNSLKEIFNKW